MKKKRIRKFILCVPCIILVVSLGWFVLVEVRYTNYKRNLERISPFHYIGFRGDYGFVVNVPGYLHFRTGNCSVSNADASLTLEIWPGLSPDGNSYGVVLHDKDGETYNIFTDRDLKPLSSGDEVLFSEHAEELEKLKQKTREVWGEQY